MRTASNGSRSGRACPAPTCSPVPINLIGTPVTPLIDRAAPPRASPSSFVRITPVSPTPSWNPRAIFTASCPVIPSATSNTSFGPTAAFSAFNSSIISASICRRPAVSTITVRARTDSASRKASCTSACTGAACCAPTPTPNTGTPTCSPNCCSCSAAAGRCAAEQRRNLVMHQLDDLLAGTDGFDLQRPHGPLADSLDEPARDLETDIRLEQMAADFAQRVGHVAFREHPATPEPVQYSGQLLGNVRKHNRSKLNGEYP